MADVSISYKGNEIASMSATGVKTLLTGSTFCEGDISISYTKPSSGTDTSDATLNNGNQMLSGVTAYSQGTKYTGTIQSQAAQTITPTTTNQTIASGKYLSGTQTILGDANLIAGNIKSGVSIFNVAGTYSGGGGGSNWTLVGSKEYTVNTTNTSTRVVGSIDLSDGNITKDDIIWVHVRDNAGKRNGYLYGTDTIFLNLNLGNGVYGEGESEECKLTFAIKCGSDGDYYFDRYSYQGYGVFAYDFSIDDLYVDIGSRYNSNYTGTINGTYKCDVYKLTVPSGMVMFA